MGAETIVVTSESKATFWHKPYCPASFVTVSRCRVWDPITVPVYTDSCVGDRRESSKSILWQALAINNPFPLLPSHCLFPTHTPSFGVLCVHLLS